MDGHQLPMSPEWVTDHLKCVIFVSIYISSPLHLNDFAADPAWKEFISNSIYIYMYII